MKQTKWPAGNIAGHEGTIPRTRHLYKRKWIIHKQTICGKILNCSGYPYLVHLPSGLYRVFSSCLWYYTFIWHPAEPAVANHGRGRGRKEKNPREEEQRAKKRRKCQVLVFVFLAGGSRPPPFSFSLPQLTKKDKNFGGKKKKKRFIIPSQEEEEEEDGGCSLRASHTKKVAGCLTV